MDDNAPQDGIALSQVDPQPAEGVTKLIWMAVKDPGE